MNHNSLSLKHAFQSMHIYINYVIKWLSLFYHAGMPWSNCCCSHFVPLLWPKTKNRILLYNFEAGTQVPR